MRIISGKFKNRKLIQASDNQTRPLKDVTKESIFNVLIHSKYLKNKINNLKVLDLFSGTGSFGLECISRGATKVVFCENYPNAIKVLNQNINKLDCSKSVEVFEEDTFEFLKKKKFSFLFDIVFLDPPFKEKNIEKLLRYLENSELLNKKCLIVLHRNKKSNDIFPKNCELISEKFYGLSKINFMTF